MTEPAHQEVATVSEGAVVLSMLERALFDTSIDLDRVQALMDMQERVTAKNAEAAYTAAMVDAQARMAPVRADLDNNQTRSKYASYAALDRAIRPIYTDAGFFVDFNTENTENENEIIVLCYVSHAAGHTRNYRIPIPCDGKGAKGGEVMTKTHATVSAVSYGKRVLLGMAFNLAVDKDDDGNAAAGPVRLNANQMKFWIRQAEIVQEIRQAKTFRWLENMRDRLKSYSFLNIGFVEDCLRECDERQNEIDKQLVGDEPKQTEPSKWDNRLWEFREQVQGLDAEGISEVISEYAPVFDGAPDEVWTTFHEIVEQAKQ